MGRACRAYDLQEVFVRVGVCVWGFVCGDVSNCVKRCVGVWGCVCVLCFYVGRDVCVYVRMCVCVRGCVFACGDVYACVQGCACV